MADWAHDMRRLLAWQLELGGSFLPLEDSSGQANDGAPVPAARDADAILDSRAVVGSGEAEKVLHGSRAPRENPRTSGSPAAVDGSATGMSGGADLFGGPNAPYPPPATSNAVTPYERIHALIPDSSPLRKLDSLDEVADYVARNRLIGIDEERTNPVPGVGNPNADLMVIGEAPGADEDRQGEPFVGRAGMLLNKILEAISFQREDVFIANILKSRPPGNRDPRADEIAAHIPILYKQISLIQPRILLCVGRIAGNALLGRETSLKSLRGTIHDFYGLPVVITYHPAALLRNPQWKRPTWEDVQMLRKKYEELVAA